MDVLTAEDDDIIPSCSEVRDAGELTDVGYVIIGQAADGAGIGHLQCTL
jgi:hypothetical protein